MGQLKKLLREQILAEMTYERQMSDEEIADLIDRKMDACLEEQLGEFPLTLGERLKLHRELFDSFRRLDILQELVDDPRVTEIMVNGPDQVFVETGGKIGRWEKSFGRFDEAYNRFYKSTWNGAWQDAGYFACAQISCMQERYAEALYEVDRSLLRNWHNAKARALKAGILHRMGRDQEAADLCRESLAIDRFNFGCIYLLEKLGQKDAESTYPEFRTAHNYDEIALDFCAAGLWDEAVELWNKAIKANDVTPMTYYYLGWCLQQAGRTAEAAKAFAQGAAACPDYCFPNRLEAILALQAALAVNPADANANHFLGNLYYDKRQYDLAMAHWQRAAELNPKFPTTWRNLALGYFNKHNDAEKALECMERAFALDTTDSRILMELDQLYKKMQRPHAERLAFLQKYPELIAQQIGRAHV